MGFNICDKCGKELNGLFFGYKKEWTCHKCIEDKTDVLHCEYGCNVQCISKNGGFLYDEEIAKVLTVGKIYTVKFVNVGSYCSDISLIEFPGKRFNTVFFKRV